MARLWSAKLGVLLFVLVITGLVYVFTQIAEPKYQADAQLLIEPQETAFTRPDVEEGQQAPTIDERDIASEVQVMRSRDVADRVITRLNLADNPVFDPARQGAGAVKSILILLGLSEDPMRLSQQERVYENFNEGLTVYNIPGSRVVVVSYESSDPELSAQVANAIVEIYQQAQRTTQATNTRSATSFLETEISQLRQQVGEAEAAVARYRSGSGLFLGPNETTLSAQQLSELSTELTRARADESESRSRASEIRNLIASQGTRVALPDSFSTPLAQRLQEEQATVRARISELSATLLPGHPRIQELNAQLSGLGSQIRGEASGIAQRFDNEARVASARAQALEDELAGLSAEASRIADAEVELRALEREAAAQRDLLASYLVRFREASTRDDTALLPTNARIIQTAQVQREAIFPQTLPMVIIAFAASFALALLGVTSHAILAGAVRDESFDEPLEPGTNAAAQPAMQEPIMHASGVTPHMTTPDVVPVAMAAAQPAEQMVDPLQERMHSRLQAVSSARPVGTFVPAAGAPPAPAVQTQLNTVRTYTLSDSNECRLLFSHLRRLSSSGVGTRITVGAADSRSMAGSIALPLARALAQAGRSVVLMDCVGDLQGEGISANGPGFYELVTGKAGFDTALHRDPESPLHFVPSGFSLADRSMIADDAADLVFSALSENYDNVIVNAGRDPQLLLECATINDAMVLCGDGNRVSALAHTLSNVVSRDRLLAVRLSEQAAGSRAALPA